MNRLAMAPAEVFSIVDELRGGLSAAIDQNLVGLYLTGSLTYGDFDPGSSDIDYLAVLHQPLAPDQRSALPAIHHAIGGRHPQWRERIEGSYVTLLMLPSIEPPPQPRPYVNQGEFWNPDPAYGSEWLINRYALQECGIPLIGPPFTELVPAVPVAAVRAASAHDLFHEWLPLVDDPSFLPDSHHEAYVTLTMCRFLHRQFNDDVVSKRQAAAWAHERVDARWRDLIDAALAWQHGDVLGRRDDVRCFVTYSGQFLASADPTRTAGQDDGTSGQTVTPVDTA